MKSPAERKRDERKRMRDLGFVLRQFWVHPADFEKVVAIVARLRNKRS